MKETEEIQTGESSVEMAVLNNKHPDSLLGSVFVKAETREWKTAYLPQAENGRREAECGSGETR